MYMILMRKIKKHLDHFLYHILVILVCLIFFCSWKMPYISASEVGGPIKSSAWPGNE